ncbi:MAG TPA: LpqB family beta-propeller domain-containing protein, partial [Parvularculaceae bacterium]|nr:LpqB family beta-propeller domain-containing protein [Parvularculaceae bacterium]
MIKIVSAAVAVLSALIVPARAQPAADPVIFGAIPAVTDVKISPDGSTLAMLRAVDDKMSVVFYDLADPDSKPAGVQVGGGKARDLVWANDEHVLVLASQTGRMQTTTGLETIEFFRWFSVSKSTMKSIVLFGNEGNLYISSAGNLIATTPSDPDRALFARYYTLKAGGGSYDLLSADLKRGDEKLVDAGTRRTYDWLVSRTGNPLARLDYDDLKKATILYARADGEGQFQRIKEFEDKPGAPSSISFYGLAPNGEEFVAALPGAGNRRALVSMSPFTGEVLSTLFAHEEFDIDGVIYDYRKATATGARFTDDIPRYVHFDPDEQKIQDSLEKALPGASPSIISKSADGEKTVVKVLYTDHPEQYFLFDRSAKTLNMVASAYPAID